MADAQIQFALKSIKTTQFAILEDDFVKGDPVEFSMNMRQGVHQSSQSLGVLAKATFSQNKKTFLVIESECFFAVKEESWNSFDANESLITVPRNVFVHLGMLTVGTLRGVLHAKTEGTEFNQFIIPAVDVTTIVKNDVVIDI